MAEATSEAPLDSVDRRLRWLGYAYLILLVFEGALRKWILPGFSDPLLLVREPIVLAAYGLCLVHQRYPWNRYVVVGFTIAFLSVVVTMFVGHRDPVVAAYGFRTNFLHLPFAFIMGRVFFRDDVIRIGRWWLWGSVLMTAIIVAQFYFPQSAWINRSVGGMEGGGFAGAGGRYRPPGTFSFIIGVVWFYTFAMAFLVAAMTQHKRYSKLFLMLAAGAIIVAVPVSISRMLILSAGLTFLVGLLSSTVQKAAIFRFVRLALFAGLGLFIAGQLEVFEEAKETFFLRWEQAAAHTDQEAGEAIVSRIADEFLGPFQLEDGQPFFGLGIGAGTQVGVHLRTGERGFELGEGEWFRIIGESGLILGILFILWRIWVTVKLGRYTITALRRGNGIGIILFSATAYNLLLGQLGQTTVNGFTVVGLGLTIAAMRTPPASKAESSPDGIPG